VPGRLSIGRARVREENMNHLAPRAIIVAFSLISGAGLGGTALAAEPSPLRFTDAA